MALKIPIFALLALLIVLVFKRAFRSLHNHGLYMFFAFEALLVFFFFNVNFLFKNTFSWHGMHSSIFLVGSGLLAFSGFYGLKKDGKPSGGWEETTRIIAEGVFRYIRHPIYVSLILLAIGIFLKHLTVPSSMLCAIAIICLLAASLWEEKERLAKFGHAYTDYIKTSKRYIPFVL